MNHVYRTVFNRALGVWQVVAEIARSHGKGGGVSRNKAGGLRLLILLPLVAWASLAWSADLPTGGSVSAGSGSISQHGANMTINQQSQNLAINWQSFDIGRDASVTFEQPNSSAIALNRVLGTDGTQILGQLKGNGQVWVLNPNGVLFGSSAQVSAGGLVASTLGISDADFLAGKRSFSGSGGTVGNQGSIDAGYVALLGEQVRNGGVIVARLGTAALAAGNKATLDFSGDQLLNVQVDEGALHALADNRGLIQADGGTVLMTARAKDALLDTAVNNRGVINARTIENRGGRILLLGDMDGGTVNVTGTLDASAPDGGNGAASNGGFIETSAAHVKVADNAHITTKAIAGNNGSWLIDPVDFTVAASGGDMTGAALTNALANGDVQIQSTAGSSGVNGDVNIKDTVSWNQNTLTLDAQRDINVFSAMNASGTAGLFFKYGQADAGGSYNIYAPVNLASTSSFRTQSGSAGDITNWTIITSLGSETDVMGNAGTTLQGIWGNLGGNFVLGADIDASSTASWNGGLGFTPLGGNNPGAVNNPAFSGNFDGLGHVIDGLTINRPDINHIGLFGHAQEASFANLGLTHVSISGETQVGGLVGRSSYITIRNSYVTGTVTGLDQVGGVIGSDFIPRGSSGLINVYSSADVTATTPGTGNGALSGIAGGLVGSNVNLVENSYSTGNVTGGNYVGGLVGYANEATVKNSYFAGTITVNGTPYTSGAILGGRLNDIGNVLTNVYWNTDLTGTSLTASGNSNATLTNATGLTTAQMRDAANWAGFNFTTTPSQNGWLFADGAMPLLASEWSSTIRNAHQLQLMGLDLSASYVLANDIDASATNGAAGDVWYGGSFSPIGTAASKFTGSLDGQGHVIDGLTINTSGDYAGLFGYANAAHFANLGLSNVDITGYKYAGALLGRGDDESTTIDHVWSSGEVVSTGTVLGNGNTGVAVGGLAGRVSGTVSNSHSSANVQGYARVGGLVGHLVATGGDDNNRITESWAGGDVLAVYGAGGGLVGVSAGRLDHVHATGNVSGGRTLGGLVGQAVSSSYWNAAGLTSLINVTYATGNVTGNATGTATSMNAEGNYIGGLVGQQGPGVEIANSFATGNVSGYDGVGGLVGYIPPGSEASIISSYTLGGTVTGNNYVGGLVGQIEGYARITYSYVAGGLLSATPDSGTAKVGGIVGWQQAGGNLITLYATIWNRDTTGTDHFSGEDFLGGVSNVTGYLTGENYLRGGGGDGVVGATTAQMTTLEPYYISGFIGTRVGETDFTILNDGNAAGRDFIQDDYYYGRMLHTFRIYEGKTYPLLMAFLTPVTVNADLTGAGKSYDGHIASGTAGYTTNIPVDSSKLLGSLAYATNSANAGTYSTGNGGLMMSGGLYSGQFGYNILYSPATSLTIDKASATVTANSGTFTYNGQTQSIAGYTVTGLVNGEDDSVLDSVLEAGGSGRNAGSYAHTVSGSDNNYDLTFVGGALTIDKAAIVIGTDDVTKTYDGTLDAAGNAIVLGGQLFGSDSLGGGDFAFTDKNAGTGKTITVGGVTLDDGNGGGNYAITYVANTHSTIDKASITVSSDDVTKTYDGTTSAAGNAIVIGGQMFGSDTLSGGDFAFTDKNAGTGKTVTVGGVAVSDGNGGGNYNVTYADNTHSTIDKANATVTANSGTVTYNGQAQSVSGYTVNGLVNGEVESLLDSVVEAGGSGINAGSYAHTVSGNDDNYNLTFVGGALTIGKAALTVTANDARKTYDGIAWSGGNGVHYNGFVNGEDDSVLSGTLVYGGSSQNAVDAGSYTISASGLGSGNYDITYLDGSLIIDPKLLTLIVGNLTGTVQKTYDGTTTATLAPGNFLLTGWVGGDGATVTQTTGHYDNANAGSGKTVTAYLGLADYLANAGTNLANYSLPTQISGNVGTIDKASATVTASSGTFTYNGQTQSVAGYTVSGLVNGEDDSVLDSLLEAGGSGRNAGTYAHTVSGSDNNYDLTFVAGALTIDKASITLSTDDVTKTYDGTTNAAGHLVIMNGQLFGDDELGDGSFAFTDRNAGAGKTVTVSGVTVNDGNNGGNYDVDYVTNTHSTIDKAHITVSSSDVTKTYDGTTSAAGSLVVADGKLFGGDRLGGGDLAFIDKNAGDHKTVAVSGATVDDGNGGNNYAVGYTDNTGSTINRASLAITGSFDAASKTYDGLTGASIDRNALELDGVIAGDTVTADWSAAFNDAAVGTGKIVWLAGTMLEGSDSRNYVIDLASAPTAIADILLAAAPVGAPGRHYAGAVNSAHTDVNTNGTVATLPDRTAGPLADLPDLTVLQCGQNLPAALTKDCQ